jgi:hypothetical protein
MSSSMKKTYKVGTAALLIALAASCTQQKDLDEVKPASAISTDATTATPSPFHYYQYNLSTISEPISDVIGNFQRYDRGSVNYRIPYVIGTSQVPGGHPYYAFSFSTSSSSTSPTNGTWVRVTNGPYGAGGGILKLAICLDNQESARAIAQDPATGNPEIWLRSNSTLTWVNTHIRATDITYGYSSPAGGPAQLYFLGDDNVQGGHRIYRLDGANPVEIIPGSAAVSIAGDRYGRLWVVNSLDQIFVNTSPQTGGSFVQVAGEGKRIACDGNTIGLLGNRFLNHGYQIFQRDDTTPVSQSAWIGQNGDATQIASNALADDYFVLNDLGQVFLATRQL